MTATAEPDRLLESLRSVVGRRHVLTSDRATRRYRRGYRSGEGPVEAVVRPRTLIEQWRVLQSCVAARRIVILQAANTGLTGGSTPDGPEYDRPVVIVSTRRVSGVHLIDGGRQAICLAGSTLNELERRLKPLGREPHSVIGSSCIGASVVGGVCNNSGGSLVRRGPAFTQLALFARLTEAGELELVNHLGVALGDDAETVLGRLEAGDFTAEDIAPGSGLQASDSDYAGRVRDVDAPTPARFNGDPERLFEASGSAGKVAVFAVRLDTFPAERETAIFYIGANDPAVLTRLRRDILGGFVDLPIAAEYMHRDCYDIARDYGKDTFLAIRTLGTHRIGALFALKSGLDAMTERARFLPRFLGDRLLQAASRLLPHHLPKRMDAFRDRFEHHLMLKTGGPGIAEARAYLASAFAAEDADAFECTSDEGACAFLHRFVAAGAAVRYRAVHHRDVVDIVSLDIALRRDDPDWVESLPDSLAAPILRRLYYGHFLCHVFHQDYVIAHGHDPAVVEHRMWRLLDDRGAVYPAEHNVGHLYLASEAQERHFRALDPCNGFNPGIGRTSRKCGWA